MLPRSLAAAVLTLFCGLIGSLPAAASAGGTVLAYNSTLDTLASNVQGPTANAIGLIVFVAGLATYAISKDSGFLKTVGGVLMATVLVVKAPELFNQLGLGGASPVPYSYRAVTLPLLALPAAAVVLSCLSLAIGRSHTNDVRHHD